jgi:hypothetical protein
MKTTRILKTNGALWSLALMALCAAPFLGASPAHAATSRPAADAAKASCCHITVPSNYQYHPHRGPQRELHDYCTSSPDFFYPAVLSPDRIADLRGPCARHDTC